MWTSTTQVSKTGSGSARAAKLETLYRTKNGIFKWPKRKNEFFKFRIVITRALLIVDLYKINAHNNVQYAVITCA